MNATGVQLNVDKPEGPCGTRGEIYVAKTPANGVLEFFHMV